MLPPNLKKAVLLSTLLGHVVILAAQQAFQCNDDFYLSTARRGFNWGQIHRFNADTLLLQTVNYNSLYFDESIKINTLGYSTADNFLYGLDPFTYHLYRVDAAGNETDLGIPQGLDTTLNYLAGTIGAFGNSMVLIGRSKTTEVDVRYCTVNLSNGNYSVGSQSIISDVPTRIDDIAFDPVFGTLVGYDSRNRHLVNLTTGGVVTSVGFQNLTGISVMGAMFFDRFGNLYLYGSTGGAETTLYLLDKRNGSIVKQQTPGPAGNFTDGCSCPFRIKFEKTVAPQIVLPCSEVTYTYRIRNTAGSAYTQVDFIDTLPQGFVITALGGVPAISQVISGIGSNILHIRDLHVLLGENVITMQVRVGNLPPGVYSSQAVFGPFPKAFPSPFLSDDPMLSGVANATTLTIADRETVLTDSTLVLCEGANALLEAAAGADTYLWSDGSTNRTLEVSTPGLYWVQAMNACVDYRDTLYVEVQAEPLFVDLGEDRSIPFGDLFVPEYTSNAVGAVQYAWSATGASNLSCTNCARPSDTPLGDISYELTITDVNGCTASDEVLVKVIPALRLYASNAFSPNDDGLNDVFFLQGKGDIPITYLRVFDRWGSLVFECRDGMVNDPACGWNGKFRGQAMPEGLYVFVAEMLVADTYRERLSGSVALLR